MTVSDESARSIARSVADHVVLWVVAGIPTGVVVAGIGSRSAMLLLRVTSDSSVIGIQSDDDFTIGRFTLSGTYNLMVIGAAVGLIGVAAYVLVRPWLIGPRWFRYLTVGLASGAVVGSMLLHADGIDFRLLTPRWLAIATFIALPAAFGVAIAWVVEHLDRPDGWIRHGKLRWIVAAASLLLFPPSLFVVVLGVFPILVWVLVRARFENEGVGNIPSIVVWSLRAAWLAIAVLGLVAVINDIRQITAVT